MSKNELKIGFTGDIAFDEYTLDYYDNKDKIDSSLLKFLSNNDYNVIDIESPITKHDETEKESLMHKMDPKCLKYIKSIINCPIADIANNHMMDYGEKGLLDTIENLSKEHIPYLGAGKNIKEACKYIVLGDEDIKIGVIAIQYKDYMIATDETPGPFHDTYFNLLKREIELAKEECDYVVVVYHGGEEFLNYPMPYFRNKYKKILKYGADIVVAHHPHVVQGYELFKNKAIFYSLGNFIFDTDFQRVQKNTDTGILLSIKFTKTSFEFVPKYLKINRKEGRIEEIDDNKYFTELNSKIIRKTWKKEMSRLMEIRDNKKLLRHNRIDRYLSEDKNDGFVPFSYFEKDIPKNFHKVDIEGQVLERKRLRKERKKKKLKEYLTNPKYRYYALVKLRYPKGCKDYE